jgi:hypothetical protein
MLVNDVLLYQSGEIVAYLRAAFPALHGRVATIVLVMLVNIAVCLVSMEHRVFMVDHFVKDPGIALQESEQMGLSLPGSNSPAGCIDSYRLSVTATAARRPGVCCQKLPDAWKDAPTSLCRKNRYSIIVLSLFL